MSSPFWNEFARVQYLVEIGKARDEQLDALLKSSSVKDGNSFDCRDSRRRLKNLGRNLERKDRHRRMLLERVVTLILQSQTDSPIDNVILREQAEIVRRAAGGEWVFLRDTLDGGYDGIAQQLGLSVGTIKSRVSRARAKLHSVLIPMI